MYTLNERVFQKCWFKKKKRLFLDKYDETFGAYDTHETNALLSMICLLYAKSVDITTFRRSRPRREYRHTVFMCSDKHCYTIRQRIIIELISVQKTNVQNTLYIYNTRFGLYASNGNVGWPSDNAYYSPKSV